MAEIVGIRALDARFNAIKNPKVGKNIMAKGAAYTRGQMIVNMRALGARKTGTTAASIQPRNITETSAQLWGSKVLVYIDEGTGVEGPLHHRITPQAAKVLAWKSGGSRLTGHGPGSQWHFARSTKGMAPRPYIKKSVAAAGKAIDVELGSVIVDAWNSGAA